MTGLRARLLGSLAALLFVIVAGSIGFYILGDGEWTMKQCAYMTVITLTTVGYGEVVPVQEVQYGTIYTILLITFGMGTFLYFASNLTAAFIEGDLREALKKTRMRKKIQALNDHFIVCGAGSTGRHIIEELIATDTPVVGIDRDAEVLEGIREEFSKKADFLFIVGDATDDDVLEAANCVNARGVAAALANDKDNLYLVVTVRQTNPSARIVARGSDLGVLEKLRKAGADATVSPNYIGGMRLVSEMIRPEVVRFLDVMLRDKRGVRIEEVPLPSGSKYDGKKLRDSNIREDAGVSVVAAHTEAGEYVYSPGGDFEMAAGMTLIVLGAAEGVQKLRKLAAG